MQDLGDLPPTAQVCVAGWLGARSLAAVREADPRLCEVLSPALLRDAAAAEGLCAGQHMRQALGLLEELKGGLGGEPAMRAADVGGFEHERAPHPSRPGVGLAATVGVGLGSPLAQTAGRRCASWLRPAVARQPLTLWVLSAQSWPDFDDDDDVSAMLTVWDTAGVVPGDPVGTAWAAAAHLAGAAVVLRATWETADASRAAWHDGSDFGALLAKRLDEAAAV